MAAWAAMGRGLAKGAKWGAAGTIGGAGDTDISDTGTATDNTANGFLRIYDAGTSITEQHTTITFLDSPNTTSQIVYAPAIRHGTGNSPGAHFGVANGKCVMLAMEVAG